MFNPDSISLIQSMTLPETSGFAIIPNKCLQPIATLRSNLVPAPFPRDMLEKYIESYKSLPTPTQEINPAKPLGTIDIANLLLPVFINLSSSTICNFCSNKNDCHLHQKKGEDEIVGGRKPDWVTYAIATSYPLDNGNTVIGPQIKIDSKCPLSPSAINSCLNLIPPDDTASNLSVLSTPVSEAMMNKDDDPIGRIGGYLAKVRFEKIENPQPCSNCNRICTLNPNKNIWETGWITE